MSQQQRAYMAWTYPILYFDELTKECLMHTYTSKKMVTMLQYLGTYGVNSDEKKRKN